MIKGSRYKIYMGSTEYIKNYGPRARYMKGLVCINIWGVRLFISVSSVGRAIVLLTICRGFEPLTENNLVSFKVKHLLLRAGEVSSTLTSDIGSTELSQLVQMVRIPRFHRGEPGSIPGLGRLERVTSQKNHGLLTTDRKE